VWRLPVWLLLSLAASGTAYAGYEAAVCERTWQLCAASGAVAVVAGLDALLLALAAQHPSLGAGPWNDEGGERLLAAFTCLTAVYALGCALGCLAAGWCAGRSFGRGLEPFKYHRRQAGIGQDAAGNPGDAPGQRRIALEDSLGPRKKSWGRPLGALGGTLQHEPSAASGAAYAGLGLDIADRDPSRTPSLGAPPPPPPVGSPRGPGGRRRSSTALPPLPVRWNDSAQI
jgi:hypothetical protein